MNELQFQESAMIKVFISDFQMLHPDEKDKEFKDI